MKKRILSPAISSPRPRASFGLLAAIPEAVTTGEFVERGILQGSSTSSCDSLHASAGVIDVLRGGLEQKSLLNYSERDTS